MAWEHIYSYLKRNDGKINEDFTDMFMHYDPKEIQLGIEEYSDMQKKSDGVYEPIDFGLWEGAE